MRKVLSFKALDAAHIIEVDHISKVFPNGTRALNDVSLAVGGLIFAQLPSSATWAIGLLVGINMISSGWAYFFLALAAGKKA